MDGTEIRSPACKAVVKVEEPEPTEPTCDSWIVQPSIGLVPLDVLGDGVFTDPDNQVSSTFVEWGDGNISQTDLDPTNVPHTYTEAGNFTSRLVLVKLDGTEIRSPACKAVVKVEGPDDEPDKGGLHFDKVTYVPCGVVVEAYQHYLAGGEGWEGVWLAENSYLRELLLQDGSSFSYNCADYGGNQVELAFLTPWFTANLSSPDGTAVYTEHTATTGRDGAGGWILWDHTSTLWGVVPTSGEFLPVPVPGSSVKNPWTWISEQLGQSYILTPSHLECPPVPFGIGESWPSVYCGRFTNRIEAPPPDEPPDEDVVPAYGVNMPTGQMVWSDNHVGTIQLGSCNIPIISVEGAQTSEWSKAGFRQDRSFIGVHNTLGGLDCSNPGGWLLQYRPGDTIVITIDGVTAEYVVSGYTNIERGSDWESRFDQLEQQLDGSLTLFTCNGYDSTTSLFETFRVVTLAPAG